MGGASDFNRPVGHADYPNFEGWLAGQNSETGEALVVVNKPGEMPRVRETQNIWYPIAKLTGLAETEQPHGRRNATARKSS